MSTSRSARTGMFAIGSTVMSSPRSCTSVTHIRTSRPFTRTPHVPHEAWRHECRSIRDGSWCSWIHLSPSSRVIRSASGTAKVSKREALSPRLYRKTWNRRFSIASTACWSVAVCTALTSGGGVVGGVGKQDGLAGPALGFDAKLAADDVRAELGHAAERRALASRDGDEPFDPV